MQETSHGCTGMYFLVMYPGIIGCFGSRKIIHSASSFAAPEWAAPSGDSVAEASSSAKPSAPGWSSLLSQDCSTSALPVPLDAATSCDDSATASSRRRQPASGTPPHPLQHSQAPASTSGGVKLIQSQWNRLHVLVKLFYDTVYGEKDPLKRLHVAGNAITHLLELKSH